MPVIANAAKALRKDRRRTVVNHQVRQRMYTSLKKIVKTKDQALLPDAFSILDRAAKKKIIHKNKAARIKAQMTRLVTSA